MSTYLIDFENVKSGGLAGMDHIRKEDSVHLFWSARENKITIDMMEMIRSSESEIVMHKAVTGERDALDHQLCSYLGFLAGSRGETDFVIVSNDKAYDHLIEFWKELDDRIHIQRVSEISRVSEAVSAAESPGDTIAEVRTDTADAEVLRTDKKQNDHAVRNERPESAERTVPDTYANRNSRRRERGSRYLKGGRTGRGSRKNNYTDNYAEERTEEEKTADRIRETAMYQPEVQESPEISVSPEVEKAPEIPVSPEAEKAPEISESREVQESPEPKKDSAAAFVVTGIRTGILVESGFTADGILKTDSKPFGVPDRKNASEAISEKRPESIAVAVRAEKAASEQPREAASETASEEPEEAAAQAASEEPEEAAAQAASEEPKEAVAQAASEEPKEAAAQAASEEPKEATAQAASEESEEAAAQAASEESSQAATAKNTEKPEKKVSEKVENIQVEKPAETAEDSGEAAGDTAANEVVSEKKPRSRVSRSASRVKRERTPKKEKAEHFPEIRIPIIEADVIAKCEEAADAEWTGEVVRLINHSKDKKELYSAIVKLLGQEKGRNVYHAIKVLK